MLGYTNMHNDQHIVIELIYGFLLKYTYRVCWVSRIGQVSLFSVTETELSVQSTQSVLVI